MRPAPLVGIALLAAADALVLGGIGAASVVAWQRVTASTDLSLAAYGHLWPLLLVFVAIFAVLGLYRQVALGAAEELKRCAQGLALGFLAAAALLFLAKAGGDYSRGVFILTLIGALPALPLVRQRLRQALARARLWGHPVVVLGGGITGRQVVRVLRRDPSLGLRPVAVLDDGLAVGHDCGGVAVAGPLADAAEIARRLDVHHAIVAMPGAPAERLRELEHANRDVYPHLLIVPNICGFVAVGVVGRDLGGILGLEMRRNLLLRLPRLVKRASDLALAALLALPIGALILLIALAIRLDSRGPVFFRHARVGRGGRTFQAWKFRSMVANSQEVLAELLARDAQARAEWEADHKLRDDPRITRVGRLLRLTSLDELPQAWNVLTGDMSFIGPRPIVAAEVAKYGEVFDLYQQVRPGISGLWQVSGRNDTTYAERVALDDYYVRNWSVWLDLHILIRTVRVVLLGKGAY